MAFTVPCTHIATKANARAKLILKSFLSHDALSLTRAYITFVRPLLEYASLVWSPNFKCDVDLVEGVQRAFTRKLFYLCRMAPASYSDRLQLLGLQRLELRRIHSDLLLMFKLTHGVVNSRLCDVIQRAPRIGLQGHRYKLYVPSAKKLSLYTHFIYHTIPIWNSLPDSYFTPDSFSAFKNKILKNVFLDYTIGSD